MKQKFKTRSLEGIAVEMIHRAFIDAFSEYEVPIEMPMDKLMEMIKIRDLNMAFSTGCFDATQLVGFIICGYREKNGIRECYDGGTGVIKAYQRNGIGELMLNDTLRFLKKMKINRFVLEVLENNLPAIHLYEKYGFQKTRRLECFEIEKQHLKPVPDRGFGITVTSPVVDLDKESLYQLYKPSWQNEMQSVINGGENYTAVSISCSGRLLGYAFVHKTRGDVPQIGILEEWKHWGLEAHLFAELARNTQSEKLILINIEENNYLVEVMQKLGFTNFVNQWEMALEMV